MELNNNVCKNWIFLGGDLYISYLLLILEWVLINCGYDPYLVTFIYLIGFILYTMSTLEKEEKDLCVIFSYVSIATLIGVINILTGGVDTDDSSFIELLNESNQDLKDYQLLAAGDTWTNLTGLTPGKSGGEGPGGSGPNKTDPLFKGKSKEDEENNSVLGKRKRSMSEESETSKRIREQHLFVLELKLEDLEKYGYELNWDSSPYTTEDESTVKSLVWSEDEKEENVPNYISNPDLYLKYVKKYSFFKKVQEVSFYEKFIDRDLALEHQKINCIERIVKKYPNLDKIFMRSVFFNSSPYDSALDIHPITSWEELCPWDQHEKQLDYPMRGGYAKLHFIRALGNYISEQNPDLGLNDIEYYLSQQHLSEIDVMQWYHRDCQKAWYHRQWSGCKNLVDKLYEGQTRICNKADYIAVMRGSTIEKFMVNRYDDGDFEIDVDIYKSNLKHLHRKSQLLKQFHTHTHRVLADSPLDIMNNLYWDLTSDLVYADCVEDNYLLYIRINKEGQEMLKDLEKIKFENLPRDLNRVSNIMSKMSYYVNSKLYYPRDKEYIGRYFHEQVLKKVNFDNLNPEEQKLIKPALDRFSERVRIDLPKKKYRY